MKNVLLSLAFGACVCLSVLWLVIFNLPYRETPPSHAQPAKIETPNADASPVGAPGTRTKDAAIPAGGQSLPWICISADKTHFVCDGTSNRFVPWGFNYDH